MKKTTFIQCLIVVTLTVLGTQACWAQMGGGGMGGGGMGGGGMGGGRRGHDSNPRDAKPKDAAPAETRLEQVNDRLAELKNRLGLAPEQQPQFDRLETKVMAYFLDFSRPQPAVSAQQTAVQFVQQRLTVVQNRYTLMEDIVDAVQTLYKGLTPAQQKIADQLLPGTIPQGDLRPLDGPRPGDGGDAGRKRQP